MKLIQNVKVYLDDDTIEMFRRRASRAGCSPSELARDLIYLQEHGVTYGEFVAKHRRDLLCNEGPLAGQGRPE